ncbi:prolipoprotein diacylglyceryl transferase [Photobacterium sagamiensis]|uniref:prolipoprotein diacylglyceryl transferase n=1 Tax=Photobacterium sagamiensis TaxID=2910241 RepID=UPI003D0A26A8
MTGLFIHDIDPVIGQIARMYLWWYGLSYTLGFLGLFHWLRTMRSSLCMDVREVYDLTILTAAGVLIGGRTVEVIFYEWPYYSDHLSHILWVWLGGMATHGILIGGTLGTLLFSQVYRRNFLSLADELIIAAAFIMGLGRIGNFIDGQIVGSVTDVWWAVKFPDTDGFRHPVVLYDGLKNLLLVPVLLFIRNKKPPRGFLLGSFLFAYGFFRIFIDFFREYRTELFGLPPGQGLNIGLSIIGLILIIYSVKRGYTGPNPLSLSAISDGLNIDVRKATWLRRIILRLLLILPLVIPSDWTQDVPARYGKRHEGMTHSVLYPAIVTTLNNGEL